MGRQVISISLPPKFEAEVDKVVKSGAYASRSEFFRHLMREWIDKNMEEVSLSEQKDIEKRYGKSATGKISRSFSVNV